MSLDKDKVLAELRKMRQDLDGVIADVTHGFYDDLPNILPMPDEAPPSIPEVGNGGENPYRGGELGSNSGNPYTDNPKVEPQVDVLPDEIKTSPDRRISQGRSIVALGLTQVGKPYGWGATGPDSWDCSGLTQWSYRTALGIEIGRTTYDQIKNGTEVSFEEARAGDLIFSNFSAPGRPEHVSINMDGPDDVLEAGDPVGIYKWGNRGPVTVKRYV